MTQASLPGPAAFRNTQAWLDVNGIDYVTREVNPVTKSQLKTHPDVAKGYSKVPIAIAQFEAQDGAAPAMQQLNDSFDIMKRLTDEMGAELAAPMPARGADSEVAAEVAWSYDRLVALLPANIYSSLPQSFEVFKYVDDEPSFGTTERAALRYGAPLMMYVVGGRIAQKRTGGRHKARAVLLDELDTWLSRLATTEGDFRFGKDPTAADAVVFGMLRAMTSMQTLRDVLAARPELDAWYSAMQQRVKNSGPIASS